MTYKKLLSRISGQKSLNGTLYLSAYLVLLAFWNYLRLLPKADYFILQTLLVAGMLSLFGTWWLLHRPQEGSSIKANESPLGLSPDKALQTILKLHQFNPKSENSARGCRTLQHLLLHELMSLPGIEYALASNELETFNITGVQIKKTYKIETVNFTQEEFPAKTLQKIRQSLLQQVILKFSPESNLSNPFPASIKELLCIPVMTQEISNGFILLGINTKIKNHDEIQPQLKAITAAYGQVQNASLTRDAHEELQKTLAQSNDELQSYADRLKLSNQALEEYAFIASHDLQEPLRKMQMLGSILKRKGDELMDEECRVYLDRMIFLSHKMQTMIADVLELSRVTTKRKPFRKIRLEEILPKVMQNLAPLIQENNTIIQLGELEPIWGDPHQISQLLQHLVENAIKFRQTGISPVVRISSRKTKQGKTLVSVEDNGIGFENKYAGQVFRIFERLHGESTYNGHGIGLAICKKIADNHLGMIHADSTPGQGTKVTLVLPELRTESVKSIIRQQAQTV